VFEVERPRRRERRTGKSDRLTGMRTRPTATLQENTTLQVLRDIANRTRVLDAQAESYTREIEGLVRSLAPNLPDAHEDAIRLQPVPETSYPPRGLLPNCYHASLSMPATPGLEPNPTMGDTGLEPVVLRQLRKLSISLR
jgi:hypothetical protein